MIEQEKFEQIIKKPISEESRCGDDAKYEDEYEALEGEISNLGARRARRCPGRRWCRSRRAC